MDFNAEIADLKRQLAKLEDAVKAAEEADNRPITERVKTFEDAVKILGTNHPFALQSFEGETRHLDIVLALYIALTAIA